MQQYKVVVPRKVQKDLKKVDVRYKPRILAALTSLSNDPLLGKKLDGEHKDERSYEIWPYRIIYRLYKRKLVILVIRIKHRQGAY